MVVVAHNAVDVDDYRKALCGFFEVFEEFLFVSSSEKDLFPGISPVYYMVIRPGILYA